MHVYKIQIRQSGLWLLLLLMTGACSKKPVSGPKPPEDKEVFGINVPLGGNAFLSGMPSGSADKITDAGTVQWQTSAGYVDVYVRIQQAGEYGLGLRLQVPEGKSHISAEVLDKTFTIEASNREFRQPELGRVAVAAPGYLRVRLKGLDRTGPVFANLTDLVLTGSAANLLFANDKDNFYWSRRGPSVHMGYQLPAGNFEYAYGELEVPVGEDKPGSFFMVNGFGQGYFGIQVRRDARWVLFSVWDPPGGITSPVANGAGVTVQRFGGEGTGGQSFLVYDWKPGTTYRFLTRVRPDGAGNSLFSAWFYAPEAGEWKFICTWKRPSISTWQSGFHSFLENFYDDAGHLGRLALYKNQWVRSQAGEWVELTQGRHTVDATGNNRQRVDFAGGMQGGHFFLKMGGFFNETVEAGSTYNRPARSVPPDVDVTKLPGNN